MILIDGLFGKLYTCTSFLVILIDGLFGKLYTCTSVLVILQKKNVNLLAKLEFMTSRSTQC